MKQQLLDRIENHTAVIGIAGLGYVGLPLAVEFGKAGYRVIGVDVMADKVAKINNKESYIQDVPAEVVAELVEKGRLSATTDYGALAEADTISICVPTPLRKTRDPDMSFIINAADAIAGIVHPGLLIVLESTTYPGTTEEIIVPRVTTGDLEVGKDIFVAFSPERVDPGNPVYQTRNTPKVIGGVTPACLEVAKALYRNAVDTVVPVSSTAAAEMVKLLENTFRAVNIGMVNEMALMCDKLGVDVWEVIEAASTKPFGFMPFYPGPGLGGHCIPIDPLYLSWKLKALNYNARFIELASEINASMPEFVVGRVVDALNDERKALKGSKIIVLGVAYKRDIDDVRESPALDIIHLLAERGVEVSYHDPYVPSIRLEDGGRMESVALTEALLGAADCVVIVTDHRCFDWQWILDNAGLVIDTRNAAKKLAGKARVIKL
ncbi:MAG: nucleotide sugar dehydrogenase [Anaerolineae bacterium]|nr:nucleotide sugar dehydrogenase [Anaerolineae bacterium]